MYDDILLPVDLGDESSWREALPAALEAPPVARREAARDDRRAPALGSAWVAGFFPDGFEEKALEKANADMAAFVAGNVPDGVAARTIVASGAIYERILEAAERVGADLIVMASHRPGFRDYLLGPNAARGRQARAGVGHDRPRARRPVVRLADGRRCASSTAPPSGRMSNGPRAGR